jgi:hypothetical protein
MSKINDISFHRKMIGLVIESRFEANILLERSSSSWALELERHLVSLVTILGKYFVVAVLI